MKKIVLTVVAAMMMAVSFAETTNVNAVKNVEESVSPSTVADWQ